MQELSQPASPFPFILFLNMSCSLDLKFWGAELPNQKKEPINSSYKLTHQLAHRECQLIPANSPETRSSQERGSYISSASPAVWRRLPRAPVSAFLWWPRLPVLLLSKCSRLWFTLLLSHAWRLVQQVRFAPVPEKKTHLFSGSIYSTGWTTFSQRMNRRKLAVYLLKLLALSVLKEHAE